MVEQPQTVSYDQLGGGTGIDRAQVSMFSEQAAYYRGLSLEEKGALLEEWAVEQKERFERVQALVMLAANQMRSLQEEGRGDVVTLRVLQTIEQDVLSNCLQQNLLIDLASSLHGHAAVCS